MEPGAPEPARKRPVRESMDSPYGQVLRDAVLRIQNAFLGSPGVQHTAEEIRRMCDLTRQVCEDAIASLEASAFLRRRADGTLAHAVAASTARASSGPRRRRTDAGRRAPSQPDPYPSIEAIAARAHELFVADGRPVDRLQTYWATAEQELLERAASRAISPHDCPRPPFR